MPDKALQKQLRQRLEENERWRATELGKMDEALRQGKMVLYFDRMKADVLADLYWYLEEYEAARKYYLITADVYVEQRNWEEANADKLSYPIESHLNEEAMGFVKAGRLAQGKMYLRSWYEYALQDTGTLPYQVINLSLFAAQVGDERLAHSIDYHIKDQIEMFDRSSQEKQQAVKLFHHHDYAMIHFLLKQYGRARADVELVLEAEKLMKEHRITLYSKVSHMKAFEKAKGLGLILEMLDDDRAERKEALYEQAVRHLEKSMQYDLRSSVLGDEAYQLRLCTLLAKDILEGREPNLNPFAGSEL